MQLDQQGKEFESWDLSEPAVPPRSKCFHLQPMGFGTFFFEVKSEIQARDQKQKKSTRIARSSLKLKEAESANTSASGDRETVRQRTRLLH